MRRSGTPLRLAAPTPLTARHLTVSAGVLTGGGHHLTASSDSIRCMSRTITLRVTETTYDAVKRYAESDEQSMNGWIERVLDAEDMRRRCRAHDRWMSEHPEAVAFAEAWADQNLDELTRR